MTSAISWKELLDAVRTDCPVGLWTRGQTLAREGAVQGESRSSDDLCFRVRVPGRAVAPTVHLYPQDADWDCDCDAARACEHVAACISAVTASPRALDELFAAQAGAASLRYRFERSGNGVVLRRFLCTPGAPPQPVRGALLQAIAAGGDALVPTHADLELDRRLAREPDAPLDFDRAVFTLRALVTVEDVWLEDRKVSVSAEPIFPHAFVEDAGADVALVVETGSGVEVIGDGVVLAGDTLRPPGAASEFGTRWQRLPLRRHFRISEVGELAGTLLPELERHVSVDIRSRRVPGRARSSPPWLRFQVDVVGGDVDVLAQLVYGDPPVARIDAGRLVHLEGAVPVRDEARERELVLRLRDELNLVPGRRATFHGTDAARFLAAVERFDDGRPRSAARAVTGATRPELSARVSEHDGDLQLSFQAVVDGKVRTADAAAVVDAWQQGLGVVPLDGGGFGALPVGWLERHGELVAELLAARAANEGKTPRAAAALVAELCDSLERAAPPDAQRLRALLESDERPQQAVPHEEFRGELRGYQRAGAVWLERLRSAGLGGVLADDMGLGKTVQTLAVVRGSTLVVCPRSVIHNWTAEITRFRPDLCVTLYHGAGRALTSSPAASRQATVTLTTYATLRNDIDALAERDWDLVILDESQNIKNAESQTARAAFRLRAGARIALSGTPIENRPSELWSQMHFVNRGLLGGRSAFVERYERPMLTGDARAAEALRRRVRPFVLRRLKREVAPELPPRTDAVLFCELEPHERAVYDSVRAASRAEVARRLADGASPLAVLEALLRLRQAACHAGLVPGHHAEGSSKVEALRDALEDVVADGHKALVFSQWTSLLDRIEPHLRESSIDFTRLDGSTRDRGGVVGGFQAADGPPVMLLSLTAGGTGLNLTAADHVFLMDPWWNPAVEDQAADRTHRIGQERPVMVYRLVAKDTVEERVLALQARKRAIAEAVLETGAAGDVVTREDILALLE
ncbi:MAG TPA: DEAD/DEAH box helicase [Candidatus Limnocylindrales bacterium]|nr:DEAD/DEAH box helicase [Candidatus Limnocylindrales bacterium]